MTKILYFLFIYVIFFVIYYFFCLVRHGAGKTKKINELMFLESRYHLNIKDINLNKLFVFISLVNAFIIALTCVICFFFTSIPLIIGISIMILFIQIYIFYIMVFKILIDKGLFQRKLRKIKVKRK